MYRKKLEESLKKGEIELANTLSDINKGGIKMSV